MMTFVSMMLWINFMIVASTIFGLFILFGLFFFVSWRAYPHDERSMSREIHDYIIFIFKNIKMT